MSKPLTREEVKSLYHSPSGSLTQDHICATALALYDIQAADRERIAALERALEPFAKAGGQLPLTDYRNDPIEPDEEVFLSCIGLSCIGLSPEPLTVADFDQARAALQAKSPQQEGDG